VKTLFLNLASQKGAIACVTPDSVESSVAIDRQHSDDALIAMIDRALAKASWSLDLLTHVACITGPGGFMSLRVGVSAANAIAWAQNIPISGIPLWQIAHAQSPGTTWVHSTKKSHLFLLSPSSTAEPILVATEDLAAHLTPGTVVTGELIPEHQSLLVKLGCMEVTNLPSIETVLPSVISAASFGPPPVLPWYGRGW
jgi:tRNA A37 threonylcarbamoyladenosine modification protein TsaB